MLIERIDATDLKPFRLQNWTGRRRPTSFGWSYDFKVGRTTKAPPMQDWLLHGRDRAALFDGLEPADQIRTPLIGYDPGADIG